MYSKKKKIFIKFFQKFAKICNDFSLKEGKSKIFPINCNVKKFYIKKEARPSSLEGLLLPSPQRTARESFPSSSSSLYNALIRGRGFDNR
jgi:hypothetical protein